MKHEDLAAVFEAVKVLPLRETDVLVLRVPRAISSATETKLKEIVQEITGHQQVLVLSSGIEAEILRPESKPWWKFWSA